MALESECWIWHLEFPPQPQRSLHIVHVFLSCPTVHSLQRIRSCALSSGSSCLSSVSLFRTLSSQGWLFSGEVHQRVLNSRLSSNLHLFFSGDLVNESRKISFFMRFPANVGFGTLSWLLLAKRLVKSTQHGGKIWISIFCLHTPLPQNEATKKSCLKLRQRPSRHSIHVCLKLIQQKNLASKWGNDTLYTSASKWGNNTPALYKSP